MAISNGNKSTEGAVVKRYYGVSSVYVLAVNPNKAELSSLYGRDIDNEPEYLSKVTVGEDNHEVDNVRIDFIVKTDPTKHNIEFTTKVAFFLRNEARFNRDKSKVQVIDKYGRTCWVTVEQAKAHEIPQYSNGPANIDKDYRPAYVGEEELTNFIKKYLCIPEVMKYNNGVWSLVENTQECLARLDSIANYFKGDFKELREVVALQPQNKVKVMFGVRTDDENKQYQTAYTQMVLRNNVSDYSKLDKDLQERKQNGAFANTEFIAEELREYVIAPTPMATTSDPFASQAAAPASPWFQ